MPTIRESLEEWLEELEVEAKKLEEERLSNQVMIIKKKLEILEGIEGRIKESVYGKKVWEEEIKKFKQTLEEKQMQRGKLSLLRELIDRLEDIL